jgi:prefoldin beta subunit
MSEKEKAIAEFEKARSQLAVVSSQKRNLEGQVAVIDAAAEELAKTKEKSAYKAIGNILVPAETKSLLKDVKKQRESVDLRIKTVQKQEDTLMEKLNMLRGEIEGKPVTPAAKEEKAA